MTGDAPQRDPGEGPGQGQPNSTKKPETIIPAPQRERIMQRHVAGQSIRQIAREENRSRETVTKIVRSDDMRTFVKTLRERLYGLGGYALDAVEHALAKGKDARLGYQLLTDIGVGPSPLERVPIQANQEVIDKASLDPLERALVGTETGAQAQLWVYLADLMKDRAEAFGIEVPTPEEIRHNRTVFHLIDELSGGRGQELTFAGGPEWHRLKELAEERLRGLKGIDEKASLPKSEESQLEKGVTEDNVPEAAQGQQSRFSAGSAENSQGDGVPKRFKSRLGLT